jgi:group II intron reverse transcriptase/maturase
MTSDPSTTKLKEVAERAKRDPSGRFYSLAYLIDVELLRRAFSGVKNDAAPGVDGVTKKEYAENLEANLADLHGRLKSGRYRHQPIKRVHIPKGNGKTRPIGISTIEDKIVQGALCLVLEPVYENTFVDSSMGFRKGRSQHDTLRKLNEVAQKSKMNWVLEIDIMSYFDSINRKTLLELLQVRVPDGSIRRLVGKCLRVGVLDGEEKSWPEEGTTQGSRLSPLLGNVYLHYALDIWFELAVKPRLRGEACLIRYADDAIIGFEWEDDAKRVLLVLADRLDKFSLKLHPEKTRLVYFRRPPFGGSGIPKTETFDFLGFTAYWRKTQRGGWAFTYKTKSASRTGFLKGIYDWCRSHRHLAVKEQHEALKSRIRGHFNYFGVNGNTRILEGIIYQAEKAWYYWLNRRSQRSRLNWERFRDLLRDFPLPEARVYVSMWS